MKFTCKGCTKSLPLSMYYIDARTGGRKWALCKECKKSELNAKYKDDAGFKAQCIDRAKSYYEANREKVCERRKSSPVVKSYAEEYRQRPDVREKNRIRAHDYRASGLRERLPMDTLDRMINDYGYSCMKPDCDKTDEPIEIDHIKPLSLGGGNDYENLQFLCRFHNRSKKNRESVDYRNV